MQFDRKVKLVLTDKVKSMSWTDLHVDFVIEKTADATPNGAKFVIFNMNENSRGFVNKPMDVTFLAGYGSAETAVFVGQVIKDGIKHEYNGVDWVTVLDCRDANSGLNQVKVNKSFEGKVSLKKSVDYLIEEMGLGKGVLNIPDKQYNNGLALSGFARDRIREIAKKENLEFNVQDGNAFILAKDEKVDRVVVVNAQTGLVGSPIVEDGGVSFECLLNPNIKIGGKVRVESRVVTGEYKVEKLRHAGDNHKGNYYTRVEVR